MPKILQAKKIKELMEGTTEGPWEILPPMKNGVITDKHAWHGILKRHMSMIHATADGLANAAFIAALPDIAATALHLWERVDEVEALRRTNAGMGDLCSFHHGSDAQRCDCEAYNEAIDDVIRLFPKSHRG